MAPDDQNRTVNPVGSPKVEGLTPPREQSEFERFEALAKQVVRVPKAHAAKKDDKPTDK